MDSQHITIATLIACLSVDMIVSAITAHRYGRMYWKGSAPDPERAFLAMLNFTLMFLHAFSLLLLLLLWAQT